MSVVRTRSRMIPATRRIRLIAGVVAVRVVDGLEAIDVDDHHRALAAVASAEGDVLVQLRAETAPIEQARERVVIGDVAELGLCLRRLSQGHRR